MKSLIAAAIDEASILRKADVEAALLRALEALDSEPVPAKDESRATIGERCES